jgi:hypothetical protein
MPDIMYNGRKYAVSDDALAQMSKDGVKYEPVQAEQGFWQKAQKAIGGGESLDESLAGLRGGAHGFTLGLADAKFGKDNESLMQRLGGDDYDSVRAAHPIATTVGDMGGSMLGVGKLGVAAKGATAAARMLRGGLTAAGEGLVRETAEQGQGADMEQSARAAGWSGALGAAIPGLGAVTSALGRTQLAQKAGDFLGDTLTSAANTARAKAGGIGAQQVKELAKKSSLSGPAQIEKVALDLERMSPSPKWGQSAADRGDTLGAVRDKMGSDIGDSLDIAGSTTHPQGEGLDRFVGPQQAAGYPQGSGAPGMWADIQRKLANEAKGLYKSEPSEQMGYNAANSFAKELANEAAPSTLGGVHKRVSAWGKAAYPVKGGVSSKSDTAAGDAAEMGRRIGRQELGDTIQQYATPQTAQKFEDSMKGFSDVADYASMAEARGNTEAANSNVMGMVAAPTLAAAGGLVTGGLGGAMLGAGMAVGSGTRNAFRQLAESSRGYDIAANAGRYFTPKARNMDKAIEGLGEVLAKQGNTSGVVAASGMIPPNYVEDEYSR